MKPLEEIRAESRRGCPFDPPSTAADDVDALLQIIDRIEAALPALETAAWSRSWTKLKAARMPFEALGLRVVGPIRKALEALESAGGK